MFIGYIVILLVSVDEFDTISYIITLDENIFEHRLKGL